MLKNVLRTGQILFTSGSGLEFKCLCLRGGSTELPDSLNVVAGRLRNEGVSLSYGSNRAESKWLCSHAACSIGLAGHAVAATAATAACCVERTCKESTDGSVDGFADGFLDGFPKPSLQPSVEVSPQPSKQSGKRLRDSVRCGCTFAMNSRLNSPFILFTGEHNHTVGLDNISRSISNEGKQLVKDLLEKGLRNRKSLKLMATLAVEDTKTPARVTSKQITNILRVGAGPKQTTMEALLKHIASNPRDAIWFRDAGSDIVTCINTMEEFVLQVDAETLRMRLHPYAENHQGVQEVGRLSSVTELRRQLRTTQLLFIYTESSLRLYDRYVDGNFMGMDATYRTNTQLLPLFTICGIDNMGHGFPAFSFLTDKEDEIAITEALAIVDFLSVAKPRFAMIDCSLAETNSLKQIFPETHVQYCDFHVSEAFKRKVNQYCPKVPLNWVPMYALKPQYEPEEAMLVSEPSPQRSPKRSDERLSLLSPVRSQERSQQYFGNRLEDGFQDRSGDTPTEGSQRVRSPAPSRHSERPKSPKKKYDDMIYENLSEFQSKKPTKKLDMQQLINYKMEATYAFKLLRYAKTEIEYDQLLSQIMSEGDLRWPDDLRSYFAKAWAGIRDRWCFAFNSGWQHLLRTKTNNINESWHKFIKYDASEPLRHTMTLEHCVFTLLDIFKFRFETYCSSQARDMNIYEAQIKDPYINEIVRITQKMFCATDSKLRPIMVLKAMALTELRSRRSTYTCTCHAKYDATNGFHNGTINGLNHGSTHGRNNGCLDDSFVGCESINTHVLTSLKTNSTYTVDMSTGTCSCFKANDSLQTVANLCAHRFWVITNCLTKKYSEYALEWDKLNHMVIDTEVVLQKDIARAAPTRNDNYVRGHDQGKAKVKPKLVVGDLEIQKYKHLRSTMETINSEIRTLQLGMNELPKGQEHNWLLAYEQNGRNYVQELETLLSEFKDVAIKCRDQCIQTVRSTF